MKRVFLTAILVFAVAATPAYAHRGKPTLKHAKRELQEAKEVLGKLAPDTDGHITKASQAVDQALQELSSVSVAGVNQPK